MSLSSLNSIGQSIFKLESGNRNVDGRRNGQTIGHNYTNFERNLAMTVIYISVKFEFDCTKHFKLESGNRNVDGQTNGQTNRRNYTNFDRNLAMMVTYLPVKFEFDWTKHFRVRVQNGHFDRFRVKVRKRKC